MAPQSTVADAPDYGIPGQLASLYGASEAKVNTFRNGEASAHIPFGRVVKLGSAERIAGVPSAKTDKLVGITCFGHSYQRDHEVDATGLLPGTDMSVVVAGVVWVMPEEDVAVGDEVHARVTTNTAKLPGMIGKTDDGAKTIDISAFAQWETAGGPTSGQPARLWVNFVNAALAVTDS